MLASLKLSIEERFQNRSIQGEKVAIAHKKYLEDPFLFQPLPDGGISDASTAVVGSHVARFYPASVEAMLRAASSASLDIEKVARDEEGRTSPTATMQELERMPPGTPIPFGTILPLLPGTLTGTGDSAVSNGEMSGPVYGFYLFQGNYNKFYRTRFNGQEGYVFGADLYMKDPLSNRIASDLYLSKGKPAAFHAVSGSQPLRPELIKRLEADRLAFEATFYGEDFRLWTDKPDDLLANYMNVRTEDDNKPTQTVFLTTDIASHAQHLVFDRILQQEEEFFFEPRLLELVQKLLASTRAWAEKNPKADPWIPTLAIHYLQVSEAILRLAPQRQDAPENDEGKKTEYVEPDREAILKDYPPEVIADLDAMDKAQGFSISAVLSKDEASQYREDFSQYKPRGHYTKNGILSAYFKAMMWFGRINFMIAQEGSAPLPAANGTSADSTALTLSMEPTALLLTELVRQDPGLYQAWADLFDPITALIGLSDDLSFAEVLPLWKDQNVSDLAAWASSKDNLLAFMEEAHKRLRPPAISGNSVLWGPSEGEEHAPPMGWRLFGQRFTWDSYVHEQVSPPRLMSRDMVRGLDIMAAFGSKTAESLLADTDYKTMEGLQDRIASAAQIFARWSDDDWNKTYYTQALRTIKAQACFEQGAGFYFTESPAWNLKAMVSSHGTWAELRHDTLLYVKQVYGERAGDGDFNATFRIDELPKPVHYIEPNLAFWLAELNAVEGLYRVLDHYRLLDDEGRAALEGLKKLYTRAISIVELEIADKPVGRKDLNWIPKFAGELVPLVMVYNRGGSVEEEQLKMALIADVYTNAEKGLVLEVGTGVPLRMFVPLNDAQGGKRIAVGFTFSYYEFNQPMNDRLTDEAWKTSVYPDGSRVTDKLPFWEKGLALPSLYNGTDTGNR